jgi:hypothetical protein
MVLTKLQNSLNATHATLTWKVRVPSVTLVQIS